MEYAVNPPKLRKIELLLLEICLASLRILYCLPASFLLELRIVIILRVAEEIGEGRIEIDKSHLERLAIGFSESVLCFLKNIQKLSRLIVSNGFMTSLMGLALVFKCPVIGYTAHCLHLVAMRLPVLRLDIVCNGRLLPYLNYITSGYI